MLNRITAALVLMAGFGLGGCVGLDKPNAVAVCAAHKNCSDEPQSGGAPGTGGATSSGGSGVSASGGAGGNGATSVPGTGGGGGGTTGLDARGTGGVVATGGVERDAGIDVPLGGAIGSGGAAQGTGGVRDAAIATGGVPGSGGMIGSGGSASGGAPSTGGTISTGGSTTVDARVSTDASPLLTGLVAYYTFDSYSGTDLPDSSSKGNTGKLSTDGSGTPYELVTGKVGKALALHKAGLGYVRVPTTVFAGTTDITIALWVNVTTSQNWQRVLDVGINAKISNNTQTGTKYLNIVPKNDGSNMLFSITTNGYGSEQTLSAANANTGTWTHVAVVLAAEGGGKLYVNGAQAGTNTSLTLRASELGTIDYAFIGKSQFSADPSFDGIVDEFRVYNRALSQQDIQALYGFTGS